MKDECFRYECLAREKVIKDQAGQLRDMKTMIDRLELKLMSKRGKIALLRMQLNNVESMA